MKNKKGKKTKRLRPRRKPFNTWWYIRPWPYTPGIAKMERANRKNRKCHKKKAFKGKRYT